MYLIGGHRSSFIVATMKSKPNPGILVLHEERGWIVIPVSLSNPAPHAGQECQGSALIPKPAFDRDGGEW